MDGMMLSPEERLKRDRASKKKWLENNPEKMKAARDTWRVANPELQRSQTAAWSAKNKEWIKERKAKRYAANPDQWKATAAKWREKNKPVRKETARQWREANRDRCSKKAAEWRNANRDKMNATHTAWAKANRGKMAASLAQRRAKQIKATPAWANKFFIGEAYRLSALRTNNLGFKWNVDHIIPLRSKKVCGLHVENNLRVIPAIVNFRKGNRFSDVPHCPALDWMG